MLATLLPDSDRIRARLQARFHTASREAFDLLAAVGRDCVGALQLLPPETTPEDVFRIDVEPLDEVGVAHAADRLRRERPLWTGC